MKTSQTQTQQIDLDALFAGCENGIEIVFSSSRRGYTAGQLAYVAMASDPFSMDSESGFAELIAVEDPEVIEHIAAIRRIAHMDVRELLAVESN